jgi:hypothetical protein
VTKTYEQLCLYIYGWMTIGGASGTNVWTHRGP